MTQCNPVPDAANTPADTEAPVPRSALRQGSHWRTFARVSTLTLSVWLLSGCVVDLSRFASAVGAAAAELTCAVLEVFFHCQV